MLTMHCTELKQSRSERLVPEGYWSGLLISAAIWILPITMVFLLSHA